MTDDLGRPEYHATPARGWMNDPNGLVLASGVFHAYFQHNPDGSDWGNMSWGHLTSQDLVSWTEHPVALRYGAGEMVFSGSTVVDADNTSGFGEIDADSGPIVAVYTSVAATGAQTQALAYSNDDGYTWTRYARNPVLDRGSHDFRDPKVTRFRSPGGASFWLMTVVEAVDRQVLFYRSENLRDWEFLSSFSDPRGEPPNRSTVWECPDLIRVPDADGTEAVWVLVISVLAPGPDGRSETIYFVGDFDGQTFSQRADTPGRLDRGCDYYAPTSFSGLHGDRVITMAWMSNWSYAGRVPTDPWRGSLSLPRELTARRTFPTPGGEPSIVLCQRVPAEVERAFAEPEGLANVPFVLTGPQRFGRLGATRLRITADPGDADSVELEFLGSADRDALAPVTIRYHRRDDTLVIERRQIGATALIEGFGSVVTAPIQLVDGVLDLIVWIDTGSIEVQTADGLTWLTMLAFPSGGWQGWSLDAVGAPVEVLRLESAQLRSTRTRRPIAGAEAGPYVAADGS